MGKKPNTQECVNFGRKMSLNVCDIEVLSGEVCVGSRNDDHIFFGDSLGYGEKMLEERVKIFLMDHERESYNQIDLEDVLQFAKKFCPKMCDRIFKK